MENNKSITDILDKVLRLIGWHQQKSQLVVKNHKPPFFKEGEIWWCYLGENIGTEIIGKGSKFMRTVIIYKKLSAYTFLGIPTSTKIKEGQWYVNFTHRNTNMDAVLSQLVTLDYRRLDKSIGRLDQKKFDDIATGFANLYNKNPKIDQDKSPKRIGGRETISNTL